MRVTTYRMCTYCIMDTSDRYITFDRSGRCNYCRRYEKLKKTVAYNSHPEGLQRLVETIKASAAQKAYDCLLAFSGGVDSAYMAYLVSKLGLRAIAVRVEDGWYSQVCRENCQLILDRLGLESETYVLPREELRDLH